MKLRYLKKNILIYYILFIITPVAKNEFINYMKSHRRAMKHETKCSGIEDIITNIYEYFIFELNGSRHKDVLRMIKKNRGIITEAIMKRWIEDNYHKNYIEKKKGCD
jgi:hypothetical protein